MTDLWVASRSGALVPLGAYSATADTVPPLPPTGLTVQSVSARSCTLTWQPAVDQVGVDHYDVWRVGTPTARVAIGVTARQTTVSGLTPATRYLLYVTAVDAAGNMSAPSQPVAVTTGTGTAPPLATALLVGAEAAAPVDDTTETRTQTINRVHAELSPASGQPMTILRCYSPPNARPATWADMPDSAAIDAAGMLPWWSTAASYDLQTAGQRGDPAYVAWLQGYVTTLPTGSYLTTHHEWENDGVTAATWRIAYERFYDLVKEVRPDLQVGPCYMTYQWAKGRLVDQLGGPDACTPTPGKCDFFGTDTYCMQSQRTDPLRRLNDDDRHMRWHKQFAQYGKPLQLVERGLDHTGAYATAAGGDAEVDTLIAQILLDDEQWMLANGYHLACYWQAKGGINELTPGTQRQAAWRAIAGRGRSL